MRLLPLALPGVPPRAEQLVRGRVAQQAAAALDPTLQGAERQTALAQAVDAWIAAHADDYGRDVAAETTRLREALQYRDAAGRPRTLLGDYDSYTWLRAARTGLETGESCDALVDGACRDTFTLAPLGVTTPYGHSPHVAAIIAVQRVATWFDAQWPLPASAYLVPVLLGMLGVVPAFCIANGLAGPVGGVAAGIISALHPLLLQRSLGSDNDIWNVVLPLYMVWAVLAGLGATTRVRQALGGGVGGTVLALHAAVWRGWEFGFAVVVAGLAAALAFHALAWIAQRREARIWGAAGVRAVGVVGLAYLAAAWLGTGGATLSVLSQIVPAALAPAAPIADATVSFWPPTLETVGELSAMSLGGIAAQSYGVLIFFVGWLGLLLLVLPRRHWLAGHFAVLSGSALLYRYLLTTVGLNNAALVGLLALPLGAALAVDLMRDDAEASQDASDIGAGLVVAVWLLAALLLSYRAVRFMLLLAAPFGLAAGVAIGRLHLALDEWATPYGRLARGAVTAAALALLFLPLRISYGTAGAYLPRIDRAWVEAFSAIDASTPPDAIVNTWWDYGYWAKYYTRRRVSADGSSLLTHVPHWLARAQLASSEAESLGLLRMLNCGSDAQPYPEGAAGAHARLVQHGLDPLAAYDAVVRLAPLDRAAADAALAELDLDAAARADVLAATHCTPPAARLVLSSAQVNLAGWWRIGKWDVHTRRPGSRGLLTSEWVSCAPTGALWRCPIGAVDAPQHRIDTVVYPADDPRQARVATTQLDSGQTAEAPPDRLLLAGADGVVTVGDRDADGVGVVIDTVGHRVLVGSPSGIGSSFVRLMYLDGRDMLHFRRVDERNGAWGNRVVTWAVDWP
ncbi:MAG: STT3 domain-containing protein [bacterium]